jgi:General secretion pathway protein M.
MNEQDKHYGDTEPQMEVNDYGTTKDSAVVIEEPTRTVLLTETETIVIDKPTHVEITPANRPRKVYKGMWGPTEIAAAGVALLTILGVAALYLFFVVPSNNELEQARVDRDRLERERSQAQAKYGGIESTQEQVAKLLTSVDDFESNHLPLAANGRTALYQRINSLIVGYGLTNTNGPDFAPLETLADPTSQEQSQDSGRARFQSLFPGVYVTMTVEGSYQNIRRFLREIETGNDFVLVSSVELEPSDSQRETPNRQAAQPAGSADQFNQGFQQQPAQPRRPQGRTVGEVVSLRLEMAAYFRRQNLMAVPGTETPAQN